MSRRSDFGNTPTPAHSTTEGDVYGEAEQHPAVGPELQGTPGKQHKAGQKIRQRAVDRFETAKKGGHRDLPDTHVPNKGKSAYKKSGVEPKGPAHSAGAKQL